MTTPHDPMLTVKEAAMVLRLHPEYLRQLVRDGKILGHQRSPGCQILIRRSTAVRWREGNPRTKNN